MTGAGTRLASGSNGTTASAADDTLLKAVGLSLMATATIKPFSAVSDLATATLYRIRQWLAMLAVQAELAIGIWLLGGPQPHVARASHRRDRERALTLVE